jgi:hypothetical protein
MRIPRLKLKGALTLVFAASVLLWLQMVGLIVLLVGTLVLALMLVSLHNRSRVTGEMKAEGDRPRSLTRAGVIGYSIAVALAIVWVGCIWTWQYFDHESDKLKASPRPVVREAPVIILERQPNVDIPGL